MFLNASLIESPFGMEQIEENIPQGTDGKPWQDYWVSKQYYLHPSPPHSVQSGCWGPRNTGSEGAIEECHKSTNPMDVL